MRLTRLLKTLTINYFTPEQPDAARIKVPKTLQALHRCGLPSAIGAHETKYLPFDHVERDIVYCDRLVSPLMVDCAV